MTPSRRPAPDPVGASRVNSPLGSPRPAAVIVLAPLIGYLPMAGLAALLLLVAWNMSEAKHFGHILRVAPRSDVLVLVTCFVLTVVFDMVVAVSVGVVLAALLFMRRMAEITNARRKRARIPAIYFAIGLLALLVVVFAIGNQNFLSPYNLNTIASY